METQEIKVTNNHEMPQQFSHIKFAIRSILIVQLIYIFGSVLLDLLIIWLKLSSFQRYSLGVLEIIFLFIPTYLFAKKSTLPLKVIFRLGNKISIKVIIISIIGLIIIMIFSSSFLFIQEALMPKVFLNYYHNLEKYIQELYESVLGGEGLFSEFRALIIGALIPAICEESLFRGLFQRSLEEVMKPIKAIIIVSIIFGIIHMNPISIIPLIFVGMYLGNLAYSSKTLLLPIIIHFLHNGFAVATIYVTPLNYLNNPFTYLTLPIAIPLCIVSFAATAAISYYIYKITKVNRIENRIENYNIPL